jgi:putative endonuclease
MVHYLYILYSQSKDKYYIGQTDNVDSRLNYHNSGYVLSTKHGRPWKLIFIKQFPDRSSAMKEEVRLKRAKNRAYLEKYISAG